MATTGTSIPVAYGSATAVNGKPPVTTMCTPASGSAFDVGQTEVSCVATDALQRSDTCTFSVTVLPVPQLSVTTFLAFGDSFTTGESGVDNPVPTSVDAQILRFLPSIPLPGAQWYTSVLTQELALRYVAQSPSVTPLGKNGEAVEDPDTFSRFAGPVSSRAWGAVLILEGSNDLAAHDSLVIPPTIAGLRKMVQLANSFGVKPFLATIPPMNPAGFRGGAYSWALVPDLDNGIRSLALSEGVPLVDVYQAFNNDLTLLGPDGLHPNAAGYQRIADTFFTVIKQTLETNSSITPTRIRIPIVRRTR